MNNKEYQNHTSKSVVTTTTPLLRDRYPDKHLLKKKHLEEVLAWKCFSELHSDVSLENSSAQFEADCTCRSDNRAFKER